MKRKIIGFILTCCLASNCLSFSFMAEEIVSFNGNENAVFNDNEINANIVESSSEYVDYETGKVQYGKNIDIDETISIDATTLSRNGVEVLKYGYSDINSGTSSYHESSDGVGIFENYYYRYYEHGGYTEINMDNFNRDYLHPVDKDKKCAVIYEYVGDTSGDLIIPSTMNGYEVIGIESGVFSDKNFTGKLIIPDSVRVIGSYAFGNCKGFTGNLCLPNNLTDIGREAFSNCDGFTGGLTIPDSVEYIYPEAFSGCSGLDGELYIGTGIESIEDSVFYNCNGFTGNLNIPNNVKIIKGNAFKGCYGFSEKLDLGKGVVKIYEGAFDDCYGFTGELHIPDSVEYLGLHKISVFYPEEMGWDGVFTNCNGFTSLSLGKGVKEIYPKIFENCSNISTITCDAENNIYTSKLNGNDCNAVFDKDAKKLVLGCVNTHIPEGTLTIGRYAFGACKNLTGDLTLPNSIETIESMAFCQNKGLTGTLVLGDNLKTIGSSAFFECSEFNGNLIIPKNVEIIGGYAFEGCKGFSGDLKIPDNVTSIECNAFKDCTGFDSKLMLGNNLTYINSGAFEGCSGFTGNLTIPDGVKRIGSRAFKDCTGFFGTLTIPSSVDDIDDLYYGYPSRTEASFYGCYNIKRIVNNSSCPLHLDPLTNNLKYFYYNSWTDEETGELIEGNNFFNRIAVRKDYDVAEDFSDAHPTTLYFGSRGVSFNFIWSPGKLLNSREAADRDLAQICLILSSKIYKVDGDYNGARNNVDKALADLNLVECSAEQLSIAGDKCKTRWYEHHSLFPPHVFALKRYTYNGETYNLITVIIRGTNGEIRDYVVDAMPEGFIKASQYVYEDLKNFLDVNGIDIIDSHNRYLITGHSMGGAVANLLQFYILDSSMDVMNDRDVVLSDGITCYTYASPYTMWGYYRGDSGFGFAKNYIYPEDVVPVTTNNFGDFFEGLAEYVKANSLTGKLLEKCQLYRPKEYKPMRYGTDIILGGITDSVKALFKQYTGTDYDLYVESDKNDENHCCDTYMALIRASIDNGVFGLVNKYILKRRILSVYCPVNIDVVDKLTGEVVASITDNKITAIKDEKIKLFIMGDEKFVSIPSDFSYSVRLTGSDEGTMDFVIQDVCQDDNGIYLSNTSRFDNVALTKGKVMESPIETTVSTSNLKLFVLDGNGKAVKAISEDGTETDYLPKAQDGDKSSDNEDSKSNNGETGTSTTADTGLKPIETQYKSIVNVKDILLPYYTKLHPDVVVKKTKFKSSDKKTVKVNKKGIAKGGKNSGSAIITMYVKTEEIVTKPNGKQKKKLSKWTSACTLDVNNTGKQGK